MLPPLATKQVQEAIAVDVGRGDRIAHAGHAAGSATGGLDDLEVPLAVVEQQQVLLLADVARGEHEEVHVHVVVEVAGHHVHAGHQRGR